MAASHAADNPRQSSALQVETSIVSHFRTHVVHSPNGQTPSNPTAGNAPTKRDPNAPQPTPLEKLLADAGPLRTDGSDKFFGFENFGSTCYCNSIIQCLYYSAPFREQVLNFPARSPPEALSRAPTALPRLNTDLSVSSTTSANNALSPPRPKSALSPLSSPIHRQQNKPGPTLATAGPPGTKPEDNKESPEYRKKLAVAAGPVLNMDYENSQSYGMSESLFTALKDIFEAVIAHQSRIGVVSPHKFLEILRRQNEMFRSAMHQDAHEFLNLLLNEVLEDVERFSKSQSSSDVSTQNADGESGLVNAISSAVSAAVPSIFAPSKPQPNNSHWVHELFEGTLTSETRCLTCENTSQRDEAFLDLSVDLEQHSSVTSCLRKFSEEEMLCERNKFHCDNCGGLQEAEKRMKIKRLPRILALHLKRFKYTEDLQRLQKLFHRVNYPYHLRLFNTTDDAEDPDRLYELYAVVVHIGGGPYHGHYISIIKTQDRGWLMFDDELVEPVDKTYVRNFFGGEGAMACAYVLFYQETTMEEMLREQEAEGAAAAAKAEEGVGEGAHAKANGFVPNGVPYTPATPMVEESDMFASLDHAATAPVPPMSPDPNTSTASEQQHPLENVASSPGSAALGFLEKRKAKAVAEKERKAAEKELERQAQQKRKEMEAKRRDNYKKQEEDLKAAIAASKASQAEEARRSGAPSASNDDAAISDGLKENGGGSIMSGGLNRFRHTSMSLRHKPKLWLQKEKEGQSPQPPGASPDKKEEKEKKNRFSLGKKKSGFLT
ncbi:hypothetical protein H2199_001407 [Coniosporium tulheliwenetii]|uniref:Uncharacterized protein n=1 Tax=Coniosporium tulheliwenetii TaxID=3383036 RepID=A0ACC2ZLZ4_9PEZI|nr:hypothetical protein H2199_001407 [Cladosporium sp. JES 115]